MGKPKIISRGCEVYGDDVIVRGPYPRKGGRMIVLIEYKNGLSTTVSYPKYLMELEYGRKLHPELETVDHIDTDHTNNDLANLRVLSRGKHSRNDARRARPVEVQCAWCEKRFTRSAATLRRNAKAKRAGPFCSPRCIGLYGAAVRKGECEERIQQDPGETEYYREKYEPGAEKGTTLDEN